MINEEQEKICCNRKRLFGTFRLTIINNFNYFTKNLSYFKRLKSGKSDGYCMILCKREKCCLNRIYEGFWC
jgi:hypothetical protein